MCGPGEKILKKEKTTKLQKTLYGEGFDINAPIEEYAEPISENISKEKTLLDSKKTKKVSKKKKVTTKKPKLSTGKWRKIKRKWGIQNAAELEEDRIMKSKGELDLEKSEINERINLFNSISDKQGDTSEAKEKALLDENAEWSASLEEKEREGLIAYKSQNSDTAGLIKGPDYRSMNQLLRTDGYNKDDDSSDFETSEETIKKVKEEPGFEDLEKEAQNRKIATALAKTKEVHTAIKSTVSAINKSEFKNDTALYRYAGLDSLGIILGEKWGATPEEIDRKFSKINKGKRIVQDKAFLSTTAFRNTAEDFKTKYPVEIRILAHKGTKGAYIPAVKGPQDDEGMAKKEQEVLLQAGTQMRILKVEKKTFLQPGSKYFSDHKDEINKLNNEMGFLYDEELITDKMKADAGINPGDPEEDVLNKLVNHEMTKRHGKQGGYIIYMETIDTTPLINREKPKSKDQ